MNGHGGKRPGAGRPKGAASRANEQMRQEAASNRRAAARLLHAADHARSEPAGSGLSLAGLGEATEIALPAGMRVLVATKVDTADVPTVLLLRLLLAFGSSKIF